MLLGSTEADWDGVGSGRLLVSYVGLRDSARLGMLVLLLLLLLLLAPVALLEWAGSDDGALLTMRREERLELRRPISSRRGGCIPMLLSCWDVSGVLTLSMGEATLLGESGAAVEGAVVMPDIRADEAAWVALSADGPEELAECGGGMAALRLLLLWLDG